jgi:hypothetical protein
MKCVQNTIFSNIANNELENFSNAYVDVSALNPFTLTYDGDSDVEVIGDGTITKGTTTIDFSAGDYTIKYNKNTFCLRIADIVARTNLKFNIDLLEDNDVVVMNGLSFSLGEVESNYYGDVGCLEYIMQKYGHLFTSQINLLNCTKIYGDAVVFSKAINTPKIILRNSKVGGRIEDVLESFCDNGRTDDLVFDAVNTFCTFNLDPMRYNLNITFTSGGCSVVDSASSDILGTYVKDEDKWYYKL